VLWVTALSILDAADWRSGMIFSMWWPLLSRHCMNCDVMLMKSSSSEFRCQYRLISPAMRSLKQLDGWANRGGMYWHRFIGFGRSWIVFYCLLSIGVSLRRLLYVLRFSMFHFRLPKLLILDLKLFHDSMESSSQMQKMSSINFL
jgi:hypothetical protein